MLAAKGYPGSYPKGMVIKGIENAESDTHLAVFQAGTRKEGNNILSNGGRVLCVTALGKDLREAQAKAYQGIKKISMDNAQFRTDIGLKGLRRLGLG